LFEPATQKRRTGKIEEISMKTRLASARGRLSAAAVLAAVLVAGCGSPPSEDPRPAPGTSTTTTTTAAGAPAAVAAPVEVSIPAIDATSSLVELGLNDDQTVQVPPVEQPLQAGWFTGAPKPGEPGPAIVLGHVNGGGQAGIFHRLHELAAGDEVLIRRADGTSARFVVSRVDRVPKDDFPTEQVYGNTPGPELRLITCGGAFDQEERSYVDNVIVYATVA
jgi:sortase (surface protein transpeptidase)